LFAGFEYHTSLIGAAAWHTGPVSTRPILSCASSGQLLKKTFHGFVVLRGLPDEDLGCVFVNYAGSQLAMIKVGMVKE
jgi:hypothetical protein